MLQMQMLHALYAAKRMLPYQPDMNVLESMLVLWLGVAHVVVLSWRVSVNPLIPLESQLKC